MNLEVTTTDDTDLLNLIVKILKFCQDYMDIPVDETMPVKDRILWHNCGIAISLSRSIHILLNEEKHPNVLTATIALRSLYEHYLHTKLLLRATEDSQISDYITCQLLGQKRSLVTNKDLLVSLDDESRKQNALSLGTVEELIKLIEDYTRIINNYAKASSHNQSKTKNKEYTLLAIAQKLDVGFNNKPHEVEYRSVYNLWSRYSHGGIAYIDLMSKSHSPNKVEFQLLGDRKNKGKILICTITYLKTFLEGFHSTFSKTNTPEYHDRYHALFTEIDAVIKNY